MNNIKCLSEKIFTRAIGGLLLTIALVIAIMSTLLLPIVGFFFSIPLLMGSIALITAPESKACRLVTDSG